MRILTILGMIVLGSASFAGAPPPSQGRQCSAAAQCDDGLKCMEHADRKATCELACAANERCPEDQRCVKDGAASVCRPVNDRNGPPSRLPKRNRVP